MITTIFVLENMIAFVAIYVILSLATFWVCKSVAAVGAWLLTTLFLVVRLTLNVGNEFILMFMILWIIILGITILVTGGEA